MSGGKREVISFKADRALLQAMQAIPNRSEFIRAAILGALKNTCPLCGGTGILSPNQRNHWEFFTKSHSIEKCSDCDAFHIVCTEKDHD